jgi:hypothetical protein
MANTNLTISTITKEALSILVNNLSFASNVTRTYEDKFAVEGAKVGTTINIRKPVRFTVNSGQALNLQDVTETQVPLTINNQKHVDFQFSAADLALTIDDFSKRYLNPAIAALANQIDADGTALYKKVFNYVGVPGTTPTAILTYLQAGAKLQEEACPPDNLAMVVTPTMQAYAVDTAKAIFNPSGELSKQYTKGRMGTALGFNWYMDQNMPTHTVGTCAVAALVNGASQTGSAGMICDAATSMALKEGDIVQFAGVYAVNPQSRVSTGALKNFVVTADATAVVADLTFYFDPIMVTTGPSQNVTNLPADNAAVTVFGSAAAYSAKVSPLGMAFHRDAFTLATVDLPLPRGIDMAARAADKDLGISLRIVRDYSIDTDQFPCRIDVLYGWACLRPESACRVCA